MRRDPPKTKGATNATSANSNTPKNTASKRVGKFKWERAIRDDAGFRPTVLFVLLVLGTWMDKHGEAFPSNVTIAEKCGFKSDSTARKAIREAVRAGYLQKASGGGRAVGGGGRTNRYHAAIPNPVPTDHVEGETTRSPRTATRSPQPDNLVPTSNQTDQEQTMEQTNVADAPSDEDLKAFVLGRRYHQLHAEHAQMLAAAEVDNERDRVLTEWREQGMEPHDVVLGRVVPNLPPDTRRLVHEAPSGDRKAFRQSVADSTRTPHQIAADLNAQKWDWADRPLRAFASEINKQKEPA